MPGSVDTTRELARPETRRWCAARQRGCASAARRPRAASPSPPSARPPARRAASSGGRPPRAGDTACSPRRSATRFGFDACIAGASPASSAGHAGDAASVNSSTRPSMRRSNDERNRQRQTAPTPPLDVTHQASSVPPTAPSIDITTASVTSWRTRRPRPAPIASRMPISFCRPDARASSMLATFAQAISSTRPTTGHHAGRDRHDDRRRPRDGSGRRWWPERERGDPCSSPDSPARGATSAAAGSPAPARPSCPAFKRPRMNSQRSPRRSSRVRAGRRRHGVVHADRLHLERRGRRNPQSPATGSGPSR